MKKPYMILKWGRFKGGDFNGNPKAMETLNEITQAEMKNDEEKVKELTCRMIDEFEGKIYNWWESRYFKNKDEAKNYILNYRNEMA